MLFERLRRFVSAALFRLDSLEVGRIYWLLPLTGRSWRPWRLFGNVYVECRDRSSGCYCIPVVWYKREAIDLCL